MHAVRYNSLLIFTTMKKLSHLLIVFILLDATSGFCQVASFHGGGPSRYPLDGWSGHLKGNSVAITKDGKYVVAGAVDEGGGVVPVDVTRRPYLLKTSISGANAWQRVYLGDRPEARGSILSVRDYGAGTVVATGHINDGGLNHALFLKVDGRGNTLVKKRFRLTWDAGTPDQQNWPTCIQAVRNATGAPVGTVIAGFITGTEDMPSPVSGFVHLTNGNGEPLASRIIHYDLMLRWVIQTTDGFLVLGKIGGNTLAVYKFSSDLTLLWTTMYIVESGYAVTPASMTQTAGLIYVTGSINEWDMPNAAFLMQLNPDGTLNWAKSYGSNCSSLSVATKPEINGSGGLYLTGKIRNDGYDKAFILNTDFNGNGRWAKIYSLETAPAEGREIIATADSLVVTGVSGENMLLIRTDLAGRSGVPCEYSVAMPATPRPILADRRNLANSVARYREFETTRPMDKFGVTQRFCTNAARGIGGVDPGMVIFPTVVGRLVNIDLKSPSDLEGSITVFDEYTKLLVQKIPAGASDVSLDVSNLSPGLYYLVISIDGKETTSKFIKE
jgi:hypothetical protein